MGCFALLMIGLFVLALAEAAGPGGSAWLVDLVGWLLSQHAFWAGAMGASLAAHVWISVGRHLTASQVRRDGQARADADYTKYGGW